jgi:hypothetical protein
MRHTGLGVDTCAAHSPYDPADLENNRSGEKRIEKRAEHLPRNEKSSIC